MPRLRWILFLVGSSLVTLIAATTLWFEAERTFHFLRMIGGKTRDLDEKRESVTATREKIAFYKTDEGIAHLGRELYNFVYPGETIYLFENSGDKK